MVTESNSLTKWNGCPKSEKDDAEIEAYAKKIKEANDKKMTQIRNIPMCNPTLNKLQQKPVEIPMSEDWNSVKGQFGWTEIHRTVIPYLIRSGQKLVSQQMVEMKLFNSFRLIFTNEVLDCYKVKTFQATKTEAALLNEINFRHCDNYYGSENFAEGCSLNQLEDVMEKSEFLEFCRQRLILQNGSNTMRCGFVKIENVNCVPYVCIKNTKFVPLFYFEGECKYLEERSLNLEGCDLAYLRIACKIQGIRKELFDRDRVPVVELDLVKKFFLPGTPFVEFWQFENKVDHLIKETLDIIAAPSVKPKSVKQAIVAKKNAQIKQMSNQVTRQYHDNSLLLQTRIQNPQNQHISNSNSQNFCLNGPVSTSVNYNNYSNWTNTHGTSLPYTSASNTVRSNSHPTVGTSNIQSLPNVMQPSIRKQQISESLFQNSPNAYGLYRVQVENRFFNYCVNKEPYNEKILLVTLEEVSLGFFRTPLDPTWNAVNGMHLDIFKPNLQQLQVLQKYNIMGTRGMIRVDSFRDNLPQLKFILKLP